MVPLVRLSTCVCLLCFVYEWPLMLGRPVHHAREDQALPRGAKQDHSSHTTVSQPNKSGPPLYTALLVENSDKNDAILSTQEFAIPEHPCTEDKDCYPKESENYTIPSDLVSCKEQTCVCVDCFYSLNDTCAVRGCHHYDNDTGKCVDERKSLKKVLILSVFLSSTGTANSYIGLSTLGFIQGSLLFLVLLLCMCIFCTKKCFVECCKCFEDECDHCDCCEDFWMCCHEFCAPVCVLFSMLVIVLCCLAIAAWWAADIVVFTENTRLDGDGCPLKYDL